MTRYNHLTLLTAYLIDKILEGPKVDLPSVICYVILKTIKAQHSTGSIPFPILITKILATHKVPIRILAPTKPPTPPFTIRSLKWMNLVEDASNPKKKGVKLNTTKATLASTKATMMSLMYTVIKKLSRVVTTKEGTMPT